MLSTLPESLGQFQLDCPEMMFVQYLPIKMAGSYARRLPENLFWMYNLLRHIPEPSKDFYMYVTAKHLYQHVDSPYNRQGWHIDGFGTDDINYIWSDSCPTEFCVQEFTLSDCHHNSMLEMEQQADAFNIVTHPNNSLVKIDNTNVHRVASVKEAGMRTFVKVSVSKEKYNLKGNAHNYLFNYDWDMVGRSVDRNCPQGGKK